MIPLLFGPPVQPSTPLPPQVAMAYAVFLTYSSAAQGESWKSDNLTPSEVATRDTALLTLRQFINGEHNQPKTTSDFAKVGLCEWEQLPAHVRQQLVDGFPPGWVTRQISSAAIAEDIAATRVLADAKTHAMVQQISVGIAAALKPKPKRKKAHPELP